MDDRHVVVQFHNIRLHEALLILVPLSSLKNEASDVSTILSILSDIIYRSGDDNEIEIKSINGNNVSSERSTRESL